MLRENNEFLLPACFGVCRSGINCIRGRSYHLQMYRPDPDNTKGVSVWVYAVCATFPRFRFHVRSIKWSWHDVSALEVPRRIYGGRNWHVPKARGTAVPCGVVPCSYSDKTGEWSARFSTETRMCSEFNCNLHCPDATES